MKNEDLVRKINPGLIQDNGRLKPFTEQLLEYEYGVYPKDKLFVVSNTTMQLNDTIIMPYPIVMKQSTVNKIKQKHDIENTFIMRLERMLLQNVLMIESRRHNGSLVVVTDCVDKEDWPIVLVLKRGFQAGDVPTNQIASMYGKRDIALFLEASFLDGCDFYPNEKTERWLTSQGLQLPPDVASALFYNYNIPETLYCQAEKSYGRNNRSNERYCSLEDQISYARIRNSKKVSNKSGKEYKKKLDRNR